MEKYKVLLLNLEGCTTSFLYKKDVLIPYAKQNMEQFLGSKYRESQVQDVIEELRYCANVERRNDQQVCIVPDPEDSERDIIHKTVHNIIHWINNQKYLPSVNHFLNLLWNYGYERNHIKGHVYTDVRRTFELFAPTIPIFILSSFSIAHQKDLFSHTTSGDLTQFISGYFERMESCKSESGTYQKLASEIGVTPSEVLLLTSIESEARAAQFIGVTVLLIIREGNNPPLTAAAKVDFNLIHSFDEILSSISEEEEI